MKPFFGKAESPCAPIFGAPDLFDFEQWLVDAAQIKMASAFGHVSGWSKIEGAISRSRAEDIKVLLGQSFFQTEVKLLLELRQLMKLQPNLKVRLASAVKVFHPKFWIVREGESLQAIVGSSNLSSGGFSKNLETNLFTGDKSTVDEIDSWFDENWSFAHELQGTFFDRYVEGYGKIENKRILLRNAIQQSQEELAAVESKWLKQQAIQKARAYWNTEEGIRSVEVNEQAIRDMRKMLCHPEYDFGAQAYGEFVHRVEFGAIRLAWYKKTIAELPELRAAMQSINQRTVRASYDALDSVYGVGANLASKLLAVHDPKRFIVFNKSVERALLYFGYPQEDLNPMNGERYETFLKALDPFLEEARIRHLAPAPALDAFFYVYRGDSD